MDAPEEATNESLAVDSKVRLLFNKHFILASLQWHERASEAIESSGQLAVVVDARSAIGGSGENLPPTLHHLPSQQQQPPSGVCVCAAKPCHLPCDAHSFRENELE